MHNRAAPGWSHRRCALGRAVRSVKDQDQRRASEGSVRVRGLVGVICALACAAIVPSAATAAGASFIKGFTAPGTPAKYNRVGS